MPAMTERNLRGIDLNLLVVFDALMAERHVTRAARHNGLSQPAMSKALNRLRHLFDDRLFERRDGRMEPTRGRWNCPARSTARLSDISRTLSLPSAFDPGQVFATVRIATIDLHQTTLAARAGGAARRDAPRLDSGSRAIERDRLHDQLADGEVDVAIAPILTGMPRTPRRNALAGPPRHPGRRPTIGCKLPMTLEAYAAADHVVDAGHVRVAPDGRGDRASWTSILAARGLRRRIAVVLPSSSAVPHVVAATDLIATLPSKIVSDLHISGLSVIPAPCPRSK